jgi:hypothetical protein
MLYRLLPCFVARLCFSISLYRESLDAFVSQLCLDAGGSVSFRLRATCGGAGAKHGSHDEYANDGSNGATSSRTGNACGNRYNPGSCCSSTSIYDNASAGRNTDDNTCPRVCDTRCREYSTDSSASSSYIGSRSCSASPSGYNPASDASTC